MFRSSNKSYRPAFYVESITRQPDGFIRNPAAHASIQKTASEKKRTILIIDISGYSQFVKHADNAAGAHALSILLSSIIRNNVLGFDISEIEGDAILFYKHGAALPVHTMLSQFEQMLAAFNGEIEQLRINCPHVGMLSIKMVMHYGAISEFQVDRFRKIYGQVVVEAHRLLKNNIHSSTYALVTQKYLEQGHRSHLEQGQINKQLCEIYDVGELCYTYFPYTSNLTKSLERSV